MRENGKGYYMKLNILYEDQDIIVCYKPSGIATQTSKLGAMDMVSLLRNYLKSPYVAVIHRLDQPVEGILVFAKHANAAKELNKTMQQASFGKYYQAVLCGIPKEKVGRLEDYLVKDGKTNTSRVCDAGEQDAKKAILNYEVLSVKEEEQLALVKVKLETGRHHQIRVQMAHMGCPIWGDTKYNTVQKEIPRWVKIALCAYRLEFVHPRTKKRMEFEIAPQGEIFWS